MPTDAAALVQKARDATTALRDAAREGRVMDFRERDPLVMAIHSALDAIERLAQARAEERERICRLWYDNSPMRFDDAMRLIAWLAERV